MAGSANKGGTETTPAWPAEFPWNRCWCEKRKRVALPLGKQLWPTFKLAAYGTGVLRSLPFDIEESRWRTPLAMFAVRAQHHLEATLLLLRLGYSDQALPIARSLFELMMDAYWLYEHRADHTVVLKSLGSHELFHSRDLRQKLMALPNYDGPLPNVPLFADKKEEKKERTAWGRSWTGESIHARIKRWTGSDPPPPPECDDRHGEQFFPEESEGQLAWHYAQIIHAHNQVIHGSASGMVERTSLEDVGMGRAGGLEAALPVLWTSGNPSLTYFGECLLTTHWSYDRIVRLMLRHQAANLDQLDELLGDYVGAQRRVPLDELRHAGRNDPCPCGAVTDDGPLKLKKCHGETPPLDQDELEAALMREAVLPLFPGQITD
jgi:hypothetical protein